MEWPTDAGELTALQQRIAVLEPDPWEPPAAAAIGGCFVCFGRGGAGPGGTGDTGWAAASVVRPGHASTLTSVTGEAGAPYARGLLAAREGRLLEAAVRSLPHLPDVLLVNATGRDHPRRAGLALHLGWVLGLPTVGVTHRTLIAEGETPGPGRGDRSPLRIGGEQVGWWLRTRPNARPLAVTAAWRTGVDAAAAVAFSAGAGPRTPEPIRRARRAARTARSAA